MNKRENIKKVSSPRNVVGDLPLIKSLYKEVFSLLKTTKSAEDSPQRHWGMTLCYAQHAFTLIELLVVVLIIGILAAIALPQYQKAVKKARLSQWVVYFNAYSKGIDTWLLANGYPSETVEFSGDGGGTYTHAVLDINPPSNKADTNRDFTDMGYFHVGCEADHCWINFTSVGNENNPLLKSWEHLYLTKYPDEQDGKWLVHTVPTDTTDRKLVCQYWKEQFGIDRMRETPKENCAAVGIE